MSQFADAQKYFEHGKAEYKRRAYLESIRSLTYAQQVFEALDKKEPAVEALVLIGNAYVKLRLIEKAIKTFEEAIFKLKEVDNNKKLGECALVLGFLYQNSNKMPSAKEYLREAITAFSKAEEKKKEADAWRALANTRIKNLKHFIERPNEIVKDFLAAIELYRSIKIKEKEAKVALELGEYLVTQSKYTEAELHLQNALNFFKDKQDCPDLFSVRIGLIQVYLRLGNMELARRYYEQASAQMKRAGFSSEKLEKIKKFFIA
ncbi:MAG: tetratricopeptide repeat protein [Candidatus Heimdallarchaeaceae archaeon]